MKNNKFSILIRFILLILIILLIVKPVFIVTLPFKKRYTIFIDISESMKYKENEINNISEILKQYKSYTVGEKVGQLSTLKFNSPITDYNILLDFIKKHPQPVIFITDGYHHGANFNIEQTKYPVNFFLVKNENASISLSDIIYPETTDSIVKGKLIIYSGDESIDTNLTITITEKNYNLFHIKKKINGEGYFDIPFSFKLSPGKHIVKINEFKKTFSIDVKNYNNILYLTEKPSMNTRFFYIRSGEEKLKINFIVLFRKKTNYNPLKYKIIVMDGYRLTRKQECEEIKKWIKKGGILFIIRDEHYSPNCLEKMLPFTYGILKKEKGIIYTENNLLQYINGKITIDGLLNSRLKQGQVLLYMKKINNDSFPVMAGIPYGNGYVVDFIGIPFYKFLFNRDYKNNLSNLMKVLEMKGKEGFINTTKRIYKTGEEVKIIYSSTAKYENLYVKINNRRYNMEKDENFYIATIPYIAPGHHKAEIFSDEEKKGEISFTVKNISIEESEVSTSDYYPQILARKTGGKVIKTEKELKEILSKGVKLNLKINLRNSFILIFILILFVIDIFLRRKKGYI